MGVARSLGLVFLVPCRSLPRVFARWWSEPSLDHRVACVTSGSLATMASRLVSCSYGRFVPLGGTCRPGILVAGECAGGCRARSSLVAGCGVPYPVNVEGVLASCGVPCPAGSSPLFSLPVISFRCSLACCLGRLVVYQVIVHEGFYNLWARRSGDYLYVLLF